MLLTGFDAGVKNWGFCLFIWKSLSEKAVLKICLGFLKSLETFCVGCFVLSNNNMSSSSLFLLRSWYVVDVTKIIYCYCVCSALVFYCLCTVLVQAVSQAIPSFLLVWRIVNFFAVVDFFINWYLCKRPFYVIWWDYWISALPNIRLNLQTD